jgi:hypothetical protein
MATTITPNPKRPVMTRKQARVLELAGHAVWIYPRKREVCVDGFKYYRLA